ncbi:MAG: DUF779 domain-containing protein [Devosiaceae bacterium]|nr:DUF779 domain-containing protein [Devosiaceae bacterium]
MSDKAAKKVKATKAALDLIKQLAAKHGELMFHQSGGCCDGSAPMCYAKGELFLGDNDLLIGEIGGMKFYINEDQYKAWKFPTLLIDAIDGNGGMFSLDNGTGKRFITRSEVCETT